MAATVYFRLIHFESLVWALVAEAPERAYRQVVVSSREARMAFHTSPINHVQARNLALGNECKD